MGVALENNFIPVGMEQFHAAPASQWEVITKMIDECDFYLLVIGGRYGSIDDETGISYTEKEYNYAKDKGLPVLVLIKQPLDISESERDSGIDKYDKMRRLDEFRNKVINDKNTVDFFVKIDSLKYVASQTFKNAINYVDDNAGWVRYRDIVDVINKKVAEQERNKINDKLVEYQYETLEDIPRITNEDVDKLFCVENNTLIIGNPKKYNSTVGQDDVGYILVEPAFLLVYAADGDGKIMKLQTISTPAEIFTSGKQFMADDSNRESARWEEALDCLIEWGWVKPVGNKGEVFKLTGTGYNKADWLKDCMGIDTSKEPLIELKEFES